MDNLDKINTIYESAAKFLQEFYELCNKHGFILDGSDYSRGVFLEKLRKSIDLKKHITAIAIEFGIKDFKIDQKLSEKELRVMLYHARRKLGVQGWLEVLNKFKEMPTDDDIDKKYYD